MYHTDKIVGKIPNFKQLGSNTFCILSGHCEISLDIALSLLTWGGVVKNLPAREGTGLRGSLYLIKFHVDPNGSTCHSLFS